jgi:uncharacterized membrane protein
MLGRTKGARDTAAELAEVVARDVKLRRRLEAAVAHGESARRRITRQSGGLALRLSTDRTLQRHLKAMATELQHASDRLRRKRQRHRLRNATLLLAGGSMAAVAAVPALRRRVLGVIRRGEPGEAWPAQGPVATIEEEIEVAVPLSTAYNQWTQFEDFPLFMEGVEDVKQLDDTTLHWVASVAGKRAEWDAKVVHQEPDRLVAWESLDGKETRGTVQFRDAEQGRTVVHLSMSYRPDGIVEKVGSAAGLDERRVRQDLGRFKELIESRGVESGAWRGEVKSGRKV